jgi:phage-related protein
MPWRIDFFETARGSSPPREFLLGLPAKAQAKLARAIDLLEQYGPQLGAPYVKRLAASGGLRELRVTLGSDAFRLLFFHAGEGLLVIVHGMRKKGQRLPSHELQTAEARMLQYLNRRRR